MFKHLSTATNLAIDDALIEEAPQSRESQDQEGSGDEGTGRVRRHAWEILTSNRDFARAREILKIQLIAI